MRLDPALPCGRLAAASPVPTAAGMWALVCCDDFSLEKGACRKDTREKVGDGPQGGGTRDSSCGETGAGVRVDACKGTASPLHR